MVWDIEVSAQNDWAIEEGSAWGEIAQSILDKGSFDLPE